MNTEHDLCDYGYQQLLFFTEICAKLFGKMMKKKLLLLLSVVTMLSSCEEKKEISAKAPIRVKTEVADSSPVADGCTYVGIVEEREATAVSFTGMGVVRRVLVSEGQVVGRGQLLAEMDDTQARNLLAGAEAAMTQANDAQRRYQLLHDNESLPEAQWVEIQSKVAQAKSQLEVALKNVTDCRLYAPVSGVVGRKMVNSGETAMPSQAIVNILDVSSVKVKVAVPEKEIGSISVHTPSIIQVEALHRTYDGGMIEKGVSADAITHTYDLRINVDNPGRQLLPGMVASVTFDRTQMDAQFTVPVTAVQKRADGTLFIWTVDSDSTAHRTTVSTGELTGNSIVVDSGVTAGLRIVTEGYQKLSEGTKVVY